MSEKKTAVAKKKKRKIKEKKIMCKKCSTVIDPVVTKPKKTWQLVSPMPDKDGNVTLTMMGSFTCPNPDCGKSVIAAMAKVKGDEFAGKSKHELLMEFLNNVEDKAHVDEIAKVVGIGSDKIKKALKALKNQGKITGSLEEDYYVP
ncbi:unnamed protein product [marine sediment metagenome]|uniref:Uncharacterized protein n=1 Tax=marine sediment metagenome TaxID=412755 RepID=X1MDY3_9ZZZZ